VKLISHFLGGRVGLLGLLGLLAGAGCGTSASQPAGDARTTPLYNKETGRLEALVSDHNGDGKPDTWAHMDGAAVKSIEIDRDGDGRPDRWEYYMSPSAGGGRGGPASLLDHADEANGPDQNVTRREFFLKGVLQRTEEDTDHDGTIDKWEYYEGTVLTRVEFDLGGHGYPDRRLVYSPDGNVVRVEVDTDGDGRFETAPATPATKGRGR
jgi:hypothetical protein